MGSSLVFWAGRHAQANRAAFPKMTKEATKWLGARGMRWNQLIPKVKLLLKREQAPDVLMVHLGGNDLASISRGKLTRFIKNDLKLLQKWMPKTRLVWSDITTRREYRHAVSNARVEVARKTMNSAVRTHIARMGGNAIKHPLLIWSNKSLFIHDGVHLSRKGNEILLQDWQAGLSLIKK